MSRSPYSLFLIPYSLLLLCAGMLSGCRFTNHYYADLTGSDTAHVTGPKFMATRIQYTEVDRQFPASTPIPSEEEIEFEGIPQEAPVYEDAPAGPHRTTSIGAAALLQNLLSWGNQKHLVEISGVYPSTDDMGNEILLSGKIIMPADGHFRRYILVSHYTIGSNAEAPYNCFSLEGVLAKMGYAMIIPDYLGYGITADSIHPYLMMDLTARHVVDMFFGVRNYMEARNIQPKYEDIYLMGYSQGGATTMAVERFIECYLPDSTILVRRVFAGGGPYDVQATYERFVDSNVASYPVAVPLVLQGMIRGAHLKITCEEMMAPRIYQNMNFWVNSKQFTTGQINTAIGSKVTSDLLSPISFDRQSSQVAELYQAMTENSIVSYSWTPQVPVFIMHSIDDETVPYENATKAKVKWANGNIRFNFGHYGGHVKTALRFIYTVQTLLKEEQNEEDR